MDNYRQRWAEPLLHTALRALPVVVITGPRQAGKTTLAREGLSPSQPESKRQYYTLDDIQTLETAQTDPAVLLKRLPVTIDEVQRAPTFLLEVKRQVDKGRELDPASMRGAIALTGSANLSMMERVNESLAGRAYYLELYPFCPSEWLGRSDILSAIEALFTDHFTQEQWPKGEVDWEQWVIRGGFPDALGMPDVATREIWFAGYLQTYLERDLRQLANIGSLADFQRLMRLASLRSSRLLNLSELARDAAIPQPTVHRYMSYLETGYQIARLVNYRSNTSTALIKARKLMWTDTAFAAWLSGITEGTVRQRADCGFWLEQLVYQTLQSWASAAQRRKVHYWREGIYEVDFVIEEAGEIVGIEVKATRTVLPDDLRGLRAFQKAFAKKDKAMPRGIILHAGDTNTDRGGNLYALSLHGFAPP